MSPIICERFPHVSGKCQECVVDEDAFVALSDFSCFLAFLVY